MEDKTKKYQFSAAMLVILFCIAYLFVCAWHKPVVDLTAPVLSIITLLLGYYWGSSKGSADKSETLKGSNGAGSAEERTAS